MPGTDVLESMSPFVEADGTTIADSSAILSYLEKKAVTPLDRGLDAAGLAQAPRASGPPDVREAHRGTLTSN